MALRLEQEDSYRRSFTSIVVELESRPGELPWVRLEQSLFYPTSGGQLHDTGRLGGTEVLDVVKRDGQVWHQLAAPLEPGTLVEGHIDWERRYRHMQRHTAQHLLSQALLRVNPTFTTESVSLSGATCTLDLAGAPTEADLTTAEERVNEAVYANYPLTTFEVDEADLHTYKLRRTPKVGGKVRLVAVGDWEVAACGGTHLRSSAEAAPLKILRYERVKSGLSRVHFRCGLEALEDYGVKHEAATRLAKEFSAQVPEVVARVEQLQRANKDLKGRLTSLEKKLAEHVAAALADKTENDVISYVAESSTMLKPLAQQLTTTGSAVVLLGACDKERAHLLFACGPEAQADAAELLQTALPSIGGRGGGKKELAQGSGGDCGGLPQALDAARRKLKRD